MLINKNNHQILIIDKIRPSKNLIIYSIYEKNNGERLSQVISQRDSSELEPKLKEIINFYEYCYNLLEIELDDFEVSTDIQNWKLPTAIRVIFPLDLVNESLLKKDNLSLILQGSIDQNALAETKFIFRSKNIVIAYYNVILPEHQPIIDQYPEITIETKLQ